MRKAPNCAHCGERQAKRRTDRNGREQFLRFCSTCYKLGVAKLASDSVDQVTIPTDLVDTKLRIHDTFQELIHPDGRIETPVPSYIRWPDYVVRRAKGTSCLLKVLKPKTTAGAA